jgi:hypothetical protein
MYHTEGIQKAVVLWVSGPGLTDIRALPEVELLLEQGVLVELEPAPITGPQSQHYQVLSGTLPARFGFFDTLMPLCRLSRPTNGKSGYTVVEEYAGRDTAPKLLTDILRSAGWSAEYEEVSVSELVAKVQNLPSETPMACCEIIKVRLDEQSLSEATAESIAEALRIARVWVGGSGLLALLSDAQPAPVKSFVNINNFLADMGVIERDEQSGQINWANSLAYYVGHGQLWINLLGRDPQGSVHPQDEYEEVRETLLKALPTKLRDAGTGELIIERIYRKEELYAEEYLFCAPDLVVQFKPGYAPSAHSAHLEFDEEAFITPDAGTVAIAGMHPGQIRGYLLAIAPVLAAGIAISDHAPLTSFAPTLLHALGVDYADMDSSAISTLFSPAYLAEHPVRTDMQSQELSEEDEELVINRLRDLGYI